MDPFAPKTESERSDSIFSDTDNEKSSAKSSYTGVDDTCVMSSPASTAATTISENSPRKKKEQQDSDTGDEKTPVKASFRTAAPITTHEEWESTERTPRKNKSRSSQPWKAKKLKPIEEITSLAYSQLANLMVLARILRVLACFNFVKETFDNCWIETRLTGVMMRQEVVMGYRFLWDISTESAIKGLSVLRDSGYRCPTEPTFGQRAYAKDEDFRAISTQFSRAPGNIAQFMAYPTGVPERWTDWFPVKYRILQGCDKNTQVLLIDLRGKEAATDLRVFQKKFPGHGLVMAQNISPNSQSLANDEKDGECYRELPALPGFGNETEKGARAYLLPHIIHNYSDEDSIFMLKQISKAMTPDYSKLLIIEMILRDQGATKVQALRDMAMMILNGGMERTSSQWSCLMAAAGLKVLKFWDHNQDGDGVVEVVRQI